MLFAKQCDKVKTDEDALKEQYKTLDDIDKLFWVRKAITEYKV